MDWIDEYNQRQFSLMLHFIKAYQQRHLSLGRLVSTLEGLLHTLEKIDDTTWKSAYLSHWNELMTIFSLAQTEQREMNALEKMQVAKAVSALEAHIHPMIISEID